MIRGLCAAASLLILLGASPQQLDSQYVLTRYALAVETAPVPATVVFSYAVSQVGPSNIEQRHTVYRSGMDVRDETLSVDGMVLHHKVVRFGHRQDGYVFTRFAPRTDAYELLFLGTVKDGHHLDYTYEATPLSRASGVWIDRVTIDGMRYLPRSVHFHTSGAQASGTAEIDFGSFGRYWMPVSVAAEATIKGKPARERIMWSDYRFPKALPTSTFQSPRPLPQAMLPSV